MNSKILKLDAPFDVIYAGGYVGRHIATMVTWTEDEDGMMSDTVSYPIIDRGEEYPAGKMVMEDLDDCRVLCPKTGGTNLYWVSKMIEYDFQQLEPAGADYILGRMRLLGCKIAMPMIKDHKTGETVQQLRFTATLNIWCIMGMSNDEDAVYRVSSNRHEGFYFKAEGTANEVYYDLSAQLNTYLDFFEDDLIHIRFTTHDMELPDVINRLNADQGITIPRHED